MPTPPSPPGDVDLSQLSLDQLVELERRLAASDGDGGNGADAGDDGGEPGDDGVEIVLPWWQHPVNIATMIVTSLIVAGIVGFTIAASTTRAHNDVDVGFLQDMRIHHEQAVVLSKTFVGLPDTDPDLWLMAHLVYGSQSMEIGRMIQLLRDFGQSEANLGDRSMEWMGMGSDWGDMPGMATEEQIEQLVRSRGAAADALFVELMTAHHEGGIHMADYAAEHGKSDEVRKMAAAMAAAQRHEIIDMADQLD